MSDKANVVRDYLREVETLPKEAPRRYRFMLLLGSLFGEKLASDVIAGTEKLVRVYSKNLVSRGFVDTYYGDLVVEFESNLDSKIDEAELQLREYIAGIWEEEGRPISRLAIATDGIRWKVFYPILKGTAMHPWTREDVELRLTESRIVGVEEADDFYFWLSRILLRESLIIPTVKSFEEDFGLSSPAFIDASTILRQAFDEIKKDPEPELAFETWAKYLRYSYGKFDPDENLFIIHSYLAGLARLLVWAAFSKGKVEGSLGKIVRSVFEGEYFQSWGIDNLAEKDFFYWILNPKAEGKLVPVWSRIINQMLTYNLTKINQDILKGVYQQLVDENTRHGLGEYYTPEWLCEKMVDDLLSSKEVGRVLDPACGSGSFLRAALAYFISKNKNASPEKMLKYLLESVVGFDINPLAVLISRATYSIAIRQLIGKAKRPVAIPVYLSDTLFLPKEIIQPRLGEQPVPMYEIEFGGKNVELPETIVTNSQDFDKAISCCTKVAIDLAKKGVSETKESLRNFLLEENPSLISHPDLKQVIDGLWDFTEKLAELIRKEKNTIWGYILRNSFKPSMLTDYFDVIIGNPPWLSYRYIEDPKYQEEIKELGLEKYEVAPKKQKLMTQMEIATIFLLHSLTAFGTDKAKIGFVMPRSIFNADQHEKFRNGTYSAPAEVLKFWDLREVQPLFNVPASVAFLRKGKFKTVKFEFPVIEFAGRLPGRDVAWTEAQKYLRMKEDTLRLIHLGEHSALSTQKGLRKSEIGKQYSKCFRQGSTIVPRNIYFVNAGQEGISLDPQRLYFIQTDEEQAKESKPPYKEVRLKGQMEGMFLGYAALSKHILPFLVLPPALVTLPVIKGKNDFFEVINADELRRRGYRYAGKWFLRAEQIWNEKRGDKAERQDLYERLDYNKELSAQLFDFEHMVLYNAAGTHVAAAYFEGKCLDSWFVAEHKVYWFCSNSPEEGHYLAAILNSSIADEIIKPFQTMGLLGERDIEKKVLELPIPVFNKKIKLHMQLAYLGKKAAGEACKIDLSGYEGRNLGIKRNFVREALEPTLGRIDKCVTELFKTVE